MEGLSMNLNNTPSAGPLRSEELIPWRRTGASAGVDIDAVHRRPYIAAGLDQQGRFQPCVGGPCQGGSRLCPSPDACERMADDEEDPLRVARGIVYGVMAGLAFYASAVLAWLALT
jgi:hypothetical protein